MRVSHAAYIAIAVYFARKCVAKVTAPVSARKRKEEEIVAAILNASRKLRMNSTYGKGVEMGLIHINDPVWKMYRGGINAQS